MLTLESPRTHFVGAKNNHVHDVGLDETKLQHLLESACDGLADVNPERILETARPHFYKGIHSHDVLKVLLNASRSLIEREPNYQFVTARVLLESIYQETIGVEVSETAYRETFKANLKKLVDVERVNPELLEFDLDTLSSHLQPQRDRNFKYIGLQTVYDRYLLHINGKRVETPQAFFMRVAMGLALNEDNREERAIEFYDAISQFYLMPSTPTLFNSGTTHSQMSSCYLNTFDDSIDGIFDGLWQEARKSKYAGGLGLDITPFRSRGSYIKGTNGENQGAVFFWKLYNDLLVSVNQGGKRKGAGCAYLETWHADIEDFLNLRKNTGDERLRAHDLNTANWIPDLFMEQVKQDASWYLFSPNETPDLHETFGDEFEKRYWAYVEQGKRGELRVFKEVSAKDLWKKMLRSLFETGHPWITFKDPCNIRYTNQHEGIVHSSNLCTEITLHTKPSTYLEGEKTERGETAVCNLASVNLEAHVVSHQIQLDKLAKTISTAMRMLDNVIDLNYYPTQEAKNSNLRHRPVGLGSMGWQNVFYSLGINYESDEAVQLCDSLSEFISYHAVASSSQLAKERGKYDSYDGSLWSRDIFPVDTHQQLSERRGRREQSSPTLNWQELREHVRVHGMRNSNTMAIAPTATISYIAGTSQSIEPDFSVLFVYSTLSGDFTIVNEHFVEDMKSLGLWSEKMVELVKTVDGDVSQLPDTVIPKYLKEKYKTAFNLDQFKLIDCAAARQKWLDQAQSLNLYNKETSLKYLSDLYFYAYDQGLKTTYYLRTMAASKIEKSTVDASVLQFVNEARAEEMLVPVQVCSLEPGCESCQ
jgi:ribonucleoside-diphosphate reductase alpha chain